jgi:hypothetical protein
MTNDENRMTNVEAADAALMALAFGFRHFFVIPNSSFVISRSR